MKLHNIWGYGQLFGFSGLDGRNYYFNDFIGTLTQKKIGIRFELREWVKMTFPVKGRVKFNAITGDMIDAKTKDGDVLILFADANTVVGKAPMAPVIKTEKKWTYIKRTGAEIYCNSTDAIAVCTETMEDGMVHFSICHSGPAYSFARGGAKEGMKVDLEALKKSRYDYFKKMPKCKNKKYERMYYKALSVNKVNVHTPEGRIPCMWTTPDRVPHRQMWLWDSVFHALAFATYNGEMAKDCIRSVLSMQREDGFISAMMYPDGRTDETQPQVLAWGAWEVYKKTGDKAFLEECVEKLDAYLTWDLNNRDKNNNGLLEWFTEPEYAECKSGESGQDNSPRFEFDEETDAMDFSAFEAHDAEYLAKIYRELGNEERAAHWDGVYARLKEQINNLLWDEEDGVYYDRLVDSGKFTKVLTPASFFPMMAGIPSKEQAERMVKVLTDPNLLWTPNPIPTVAKNHPMYSTEMWRGGVWINMNYLCMKGLARYGYNDLVKEWEEKILKMVEKWYKKAGAIFEFYDPEDKVAPYECHRKGVPTTPPDWRKHVHSIVDFHWSNCFTLMFIQGETYYQ